MKFLIGLLLAASAHAGTLYDYEFDIQGAKRGADNDQFTKIVSQELKDTDLCLDLKRDYLPVKMTAIIRLLTSQPVPTEQAQDIVNKLCTGQPSTCKASASVAQEDVSQLKIAYAFSPTSKHLASFTTQNFPRFSTSCTSGETDESFFFTARSHESRDLLRASGIDIKKIITFALSEPNGAIFWVFGRPDLYWNDHPTTDQDQPLAPPSILDQLK